MKQFEKTKDNPGTSPAHQINSLRATVNISNTNGLKKSNMLHNFYSKIASSILFIEYEFDNKYGILNKYGNNANHNWKTEGFGYLYSGEDLLKHSIHYFTSIHHPQTLTSFRSLKFENQSTLSTRHFRILLASKREKWLKVDKKSIESLRI